MSYQIKISKKDRKSARFISSLARKIQEQLIASGLTQQEVAERIGVDRSVINRRLNGKSNLTARSIAEFAYAFEKNIDLSFVTSTKPRYSNTSSRTQNDVKPLASTTTTNVPSNSTYDVVELNRVGA